MKAHNILFRSRNRKILYETLHFRTHQRTLGVTTFYGLGHERFVSVIELTAHLHAWVK